MSIAKWRTAFQHAFRRPFIPRCRGLDAALQELEATAPLPDNEQVGSDVVQVPIKAEAATDTGHAAMPQAHGGI